MSRARAARRTLGATLVALLALGLVLGPDWLRGLSFVVRAAGLSGDAAEALAHWRAVPIDVSELRVPTRHGEVRARLYLPRERRGRGVVLTSGVHADGIDEPRLVKLAGDLATGGHPVLTPEPPDLLRYEITPRLPDVIEDAAAWAAARPDLAPDGRVDLFGISFSGGLSVVAAGRPALKDKVAATLSFGGHGDLPQVLAFLCTGKLPDGSRLAPHDYGVVVILLNVADRLVPPEQVEPLREAIRTFLRASHLTLTDARLAEETFARARTLQAGMPEPAATLMGHVNARDVAALGPRLLPYVRAFAADPALSPARSPPPASPVYLLHGAGDTVIPALEAYRLAQALRPHTRVHHLATPLITHAEMDKQTGPADVWRLVDFWAELLDE
jgi:dienelactone hydrolase